MVTSLISKWQLTLFADGLISFFNTLSNKNNNKKSPMSYLYKQHSGFASSKLVSKQSIVCDKQGWRSSVINTFFTLNLF